VSNGDPHAEYLARAVGALTPEGHRRVDELLDGLVGSVGYHAWLVAFATQRRHEADDAQVAEPLPHPEQMLTDVELGLLIQGFIVIRDQEHLDDVADWANAVLQLLGEVARHRR